MTSRVLSARAQADKFTHLLKGHFGDKLVSVVLFGSVARGDATEESDIDLLAVIKGLPPGRYIRHQALDSIYKKFEAEGNLTTLNCHLKTPEEAQKIRILYLDFPQDAKILYDTNDFFKRVIERVAAKIKEMGAIRKKWGKFYYWDLKPGGSAEETFEIL